MRAEHAPKLAARAPDSAEQQAQRVARQIVTAPGPKADAAIGDEVSSPAEGRPLPPGLRQFMEPRFGADFAGVQLHTDEDAATRSRALNAAAFTQGRHIFFDRGEYRPATEEGRELIAHELTHTLQQSGASAGAVGALEAVAPGTLQRAGRIEVAGMRLFRTRSGETVPLPDDMSFEAAERLEAEGLAAERRLAAKPPRPPLPALRKPAAAPPVKVQKHTPAKRRVRGGHHSPPAPAAAELGAMLAAAVGQGGVARHLARQGLPVLLRGVNHVQRLKRNEQTHADAATKRAQSEQAVVTPPSDLQSRSNEAQVGGVAARPAPPIDAGVGKAQLQAALRDNLPRTLEEVDNFKRESRGQRMSAEVALSIHADKSAVVGTFGELRTTPPAAPDDRVTQALPPEEAAPATPAANLGRGLVAPLLPEHTDLSAYTQQADARLKEEGITQEQLDMVDAGDLAQAREGKTQLAKAVSTQPAEARAFATDQAAEVDKGLTQEATRERGAMRSQRRAGLGRTAKRQQEARAALEKKRDEVGKEINRLYGDAQASVERKLAALETSSMQRFDAGNKVASQQFEDNVKRELDAYKEDRYSGFFGRLRRVRDWLLGMDELPRVKQIFETHRAIFVRTIDTLVETIAADNQRVVAECRAELAAAREKIAGFVAGLEPALQDVGRKAASEMGERLDALDRSIDQREQALRQQLQDKQQAAIKTIDEKIEKMKEAMSGALAKLGRLLLAAAKKFFTWALEKFGYSLSDIQSIIDKGIAVLKAIFTAPIRFVKNLVKAAKDGFASFRDHFLEHLKDALFGWLTGSLPGLKLPEVWNARGILSVALQVLELGPDQIKARLIARFGGDGTLLARLEQALPIVKAVIVDGPAAAWEQIKPQAAELESTLVTQLRNFVFIEIAKRAAVTIIAMFTPGAGIVRAIIGIYDTIVFFIQKARDILRMVGSFLGSIAEIAAGNTAAAALALERGLAQALKLVIEFLARFLKLSGIPGKIKSVTEKVRGKVDSVIDKLLDWIVAQAKRLGVAVSKGAQKAVKSLTRWWAARKAFKGADGLTHTLYFQGDDQGAVLMVRTDPMAFSNFVAAAQTNGDKDREKAKAAAIQIASLLDAERGRALTGANEAAVEDARRKQATEVNRLLEDLAPYTSLLFGESLPDSAEAVNDPVNPAGFGVRMTVKPLTSKNRRKGQKPTDKQNQIYDDLDARRQSGGGKNFYVKGHLLNEKLGGPGAWANLVPLSGSGNALHETQADAFVKRTVDLAAIVEYTVVPNVTKRVDKDSLLEQVDDSRDPPEAKREKHAIIMAEDAVPQSLELVAYLLAPDRKTRRSTVLKTKVENKVPRQFDTYFLRTTPKPVPVNLSVDKSKKIATVSGIGPVLAERIVAARKKLGGSFATYKQLADNVDGIGEKRLETLQQAGHIVLFARVASSR